ncbi:MAG: hypothetical protein U5Q16_13300 [Gammaproteobacteria bacterium]|nr:hypothetical protein [Gammaproteobacteria bacterium]
MNPDYFLFDHQALERGERPVVLHELPYADTTHLPPDRLEAWVAEGQAVEFGHSLDDQIGGQIAAGFVIAGFYEDHWDSEATPLDRFMPTSMATLAISALQDPLN